MNCFWNVIYKIYPPILRVLEKLRVHSFRQDYLLGHLNSKYSTQDLKSLLTSKDYEDVLLAWKDPGELLSMRKLDNEKFQYHFRLFLDGEMRVHYEYSAEGNPWGHINESVFEKRETYFKDLLGDFLRVPGSESGSQGVKND